MSYQGPPSWAPPGGYQQQPWQPQGQYPQQVPPPRPPANTSGKALLALGIAAMAGVCCIFGAANSDQRSPAAPAAVSAPVVAPAPAVPIAPPAPPPPPPSPPTTAEIIAAANNHAIAPTPPDVLEFNRQLIADGAALRNIPEPDQTANRAAIRAASRAVSQRQRAIRGDVRAAAERVALAEVCGSAPPTLSAWDGELIGSERYVKRTAHDPDSIDVENCTQPILTREACWTTVCQVRGRNAFGAMVMNRLRFSVGRGGNILGTENAN